MYNSTALGDEEEAEDRYFLRGFDRIEAKSAARANVAKRNRYLRGAYRQALMHPASHLADEVLLQLGAHMMECTPISLIL